MSVLIKQTLTLLTSIIILLLEPGCTEAMLVNVKQHIDECFLIECSTGVGRIIA